MVEELLPGHTVFLAEGDHSSEDVDYIGASNRFGEVCLHLFHVLDGCHVLFWRVGWSSIEHLKDDDTERPDICFIGMA